MGNEFTDDDKIAIIELQNAADAGTLSDAAHAEALVEIAEHRLNDWADAVVAHDSGQTEEEVLVLIPEERG